LVKHVKLHFSAIRYLCRERGAKKEKEKEKKEKERNGEKGERRKEKERKGKAKKEKEKKVHPAFSVAQRSRAILDV